MRSQVVSSGGAACPLCAGSLAVCLPCAAAPTAAPQAAIAAGNGTSASVTVQFPLTNIDRVVLQEDLTFGEIVQAFTVSVLPAGGCPVYVCVRARA